MLKSTVDYFRKPFKFVTIDKYFTSSAVTILDVGCGNHSASITKHYYPQSSYYGLDKCKNYHNNDDDFESMIQFFECDLVTDSLDNIPDNFFDIIYYVPRS